MQHRDVRTVLSVIGSSLGGWSSAMCLGRRSFFRAIALAHVAADCTEDYGPAMPENSY